MKQHKERGAVAPLIAILLLVIVVSVAFAVDLGHIHNVKTELQRAVDAAALAGVRQLPAPEADKTKVDLVANAVAGENSLDGKAIKDLLNDEPGDINIEIILGKWDDLALEKEPKERFTVVNSGAYDDANAIRVKLTRKVDHAFFFFTPSTDVSADAIAVMLRKQLTIPVSVVTCTPTGGDDYPGLLKVGNHICDLMMFRFGAANFDSAAWTSLTLDPASSASIENLFGPQGLRLFNRIIFGDKGGGSNPGFEYAPIEEDCSFDKNRVTVSDYNQLQDVAVDISCGLGGEFGTQTAADPLDYSPLPRWSDSGYTRIWSMDGTLYQENETNTAFDQRMLDLYQASKDFKKDGVSAFATYNANPNYPDVPAALQDDRFSKYIVTKKVGGADRFDYVDYKGILKDAGYPEVKLIEGVTSKIQSLAASLLLDGTNQTSFKPSLSNQYPPFDEDNKLTSGAVGDTVILTVPIINVGSCNEAQFNGNGYYVGLANVLLTRLWQTPNDPFDNGVASVTVLNDYSNCTISPATLPTGKIGKFGSNKQNYVLPQLSGSQLRITGGFETASFEGLLRAPFHEDDTNQGLVVYALVE